MMFLNSYHYILTSSTLASKHQIICLGVAYYSGAIFKGCKSFYIAFVLLSFAPASAAVMFLADTVPLTSVYALL